MSDAKTTAGFLDAVFALRVQSRKLAMDMPVLLLANAEQGEWFLRTMLTEHGDALRLDPDFLRTIMAPDAAVWKELNVLGMARVRWPARKTARPDGGWEYT